MFKAEKNPMKVQNSPRKDKDFEESYFNSSIVPHDIKRD